MGTEVVTEAFMRTPHKGAYDSVRPISVPNAGSRAMRENVVQFTPLLFR